MSHDFSDRPAPEGQKPPESDHLHHMPGGKGIEHVAKQMADGFELTNGGTDRHISLSAVESRRTLGESYQATKDPIEGAMKTAFNDRLGGQPYDQSFMRTQEQHPGNFTYRQEHFTTKKTTHSPSEHHQQRADSLKQMLNSSAKR
jgi:hypothetical protein